VGASRPGIAKANRPRKGAFSSLIGEALRDDDALDALLFAYEGLQGADRRAMIDAVLQDADLPGPALAALLFAEQDPGLKARIAEALRSHADADVAWVSGTESAGAALLRDLDSADGEAALRITWADHEIEDLAIESSPDLRFSGRATGRKDAMALLAPMLWRYIRRGGALPDGVQRFARYF
jgi:hypothetical protein